MQQQQHILDFKGRIRLPTRNEDQIETSYFTTQLAESKLKRHILDQNGPIKIRRDILSLKTQATMKTN